MNSCSAGSWQGRQTDVQHQGCGNRLLFPSSSACIKKHLYQQWDPRQQHVQQQDSMRFKTLQATTCPATAAAAVSLAAWVPGPGPGCQVTNGA